MCRSFALAKDEAVLEVRRVIAIVEGWRAHFAACDVSASDIGLLAEQTDRPFPEEQRREL